MTAPLIRSYDPKDRAAVRRISCETALYGNPIDPLFEDRELVADLLVRYYTQFEPESLWVAEAQGQVIGYLTGCRDSRRYERLFRCRILPLLLVGFLTRGHWHHGRTLHLLLRIWRSERRWSGARRSACAGYPAHCHLNLDREFRQAGTGSGLLKAFLNQLQSLHVPGIHIVTATDQGKRFFTRASFRLLMKYRPVPLPETEPREVWVMGKKLSILTDH
ncbi:MAG: hypothetical protein HY211_05810 [Candidatus Omnitrophica bacterium]|nr:hypothetical protein [Candidatus Omnitrophota bacterium]